MLHFRCPGSCRCARPCAVPESIAGQKMCCPYSGQEIRVPKRQLTASEWEEAQSPTTMLWALPASISQQKLDLFALVCCQRVSSRLHHPLSQRTLHLFEELTEGRATRQPLRELYQLFINESNQRQMAANGDWSKFNTQDIDAAYYLTYKDWPASAAKSAMEVTPDPAAEQRAQCELLRCIFGNPLRTHHTAPPYDDSLASLAAQIYQGRRFTEMPELGRLMQRIAPQQEEMIEHCLSETLHARGCWVLDLILASAQNE